MSTPPEPDRRQPGTSGSVQDRPDTPNGSDPAGHASGDDGTVDRAPANPTGTPTPDAATDSRNTAVGRTPRPASGTGPGSVPPWQRVGTAPTTVPGVTSTAAPTPVEAEPVAPPARSSAPEASAGATASPERGATTRTPVTKLDAQGRVPAPEQPASRPATGRNSLTGKVIDGPTRNIGRGGVPEDLPDLDAIHHPQSAVPGPPTVSAPTARATESVPAGPRGPLRAAVQIRRVDPWSTFKVSAILAVALFLIWMIAIGVLYVILDGMGVWDQINSSFGTLVSSDTSADSSFEITAGAVFGVAAAVGAVYVIVFTALTTVGAFIYNMSSDLVGGIEVLLADRD